jgi:toxin ParE1/3/4
VGKVNYTIPAERDLIDIWLFIADDNYDAADRFIESVYALCVKLAESTEMGRLRPEAGARVRSFGIGAYTVYYLPTDDGIEIQRILSDSRDIKKIF